MSREDYVRVGGCLQEKTICTRISKSSGMGWRQRRARYLVAQTVKAFLRAKPIALDPKVRYQFLIDCGIWPIRSAGCRQ
jgi:hypothetical protein